MKTRGTIRAWAMTLGAAGAMTLASAPALGQGGERPEFPKFTDVSKDYQKVVSTTDGRSLYTLWKRDKDGQMLAELPRNYSRQKHLFAMTVSSGETFAGLQGNDVYAYWKRFDKRMALIQPNLGTRSTGDQESRDSVNRIFTDRVLLDVPIVCMGPGGGPVIDLDQLMLGQAGKFFGGSASGLNPRLARVVKAKAFPENIIVSYEAPTAGGVLKQFTISVRNMVKDPSYKPRRADERVGYFTTAYLDLGKFADDEKWIRYVNRWKVEKADPRLKLSPPKEPIVYYIEHTVPIRYRRFVRDGILYWNKAFEAIGIRDAIEVYYQDKATNAHMDKDPEDARYNFIRWLSNDVGTAIGPSRAHPETGQILDADVVLTDGWMRHFDYQYSNLLPDIAMEGFSPETLAWLERNPQWDPRVRMAHPAQRDLILQQRARRGVLPFGGHPIANTDTSMYGDDEFDGLVGTNSQFNGLCMAANGKAMDMALLQMHMDIAMMLDEENGDDQPEGDLLDGVPDWFVGPMLADLVCHEVGHTLGLRHNFKASAIYTMEEMNSEEIKGNKPFASSVMDYIPVNINYETGEVQGDYAMIDIGPYDFWAIEYGYTLGDPKKVLERVAEPHLQYLTDEDTSGPDPLARRYDFAKEPLDFANNQMRLVDFYRSRILEKFVKDGDSWSKARRGYLITLGEQTKAISMMSNWIGGAHVYRHKKGDPDGKVPTEVVSAEKQRAALDFILNTAFKDEAFGLDRELIAHMTVDKWYDAGGQRSISQDPTWPVHDRIMGVQASALTGLMNPTTLKRVYDNEFRVAPAEDMLTLPELFEKIQVTIWTEVNGSPQDRYTARSPMISSFRRNLQAEHVERLIDLTMPGKLSGAAAKPVQNLAVMQLGQIKDRIDSLMSGSGKSRIDPYTTAHLMSASDRIERALDAQYIFNAGDMGGGTINFGGLFGQPAAAPQE